MSAQLEMEIALPLERFTLQVAWRSERPSLGIFGHSGAGKTSLLEALAGLRRVRSGRIRAGGRLWLDTQRGVDEAPERRGVGYVPQDGLLFPHKDVMGNVLFGAGRVVVIDDFRDARFVNDGRHKRARLRRQDKGAAGELEAFFQSLRTGGPMPIPLASLVLTTVATFAIEASLRTAASVELTEVVAGPEGGSLQAGSGS